MQVQEISSRNKKIYTDEEKAKGKELMKKNQKQDEKLVKGMFEFTEAGGGWFDFDYRIYPGPIYKIRLIHGEITDIPYGVMKLLNNCYKKVRNLAQEQGPNGLKFKEVVRTSRVRFIPVDAL